MNVSSGGFTSIEQITGEYLKNNNISKHDIPKASFEEALRQVVEEKGEVVFSKHANERLMERNITLSTEQLKRLNTGAKKAGEKGIKESLVLMDNLAFIVNTKNKTVITAMNSDMQGENIYTNIDGAVVI